MVSGMPYTIARIARNISPKVPTSCARKRPRLRRGRGGAESSCGRETSAPIEQQTERAWQTALPRERRFTWRPLAPPSDALRDIVAEPGAVISRDGGVLRLLLRLVGRRAEVVVVRPGRRRPDVALHL